MSITKSSTGQATVIALLALDTTNVFLKAAMIIKIIDRLKFINLDFKPVLNAFFNQMAGSFKPSGLEWSDDDVIYSKGIKGKFGLYRIGVNFWRMFWDKIIVYITSSALLLII